MLNTAIGYPRIGKNRELKFALEKYFKHEITEQELQSTAAAIRKEHYGFFTEEKIDLIPCGDFSFYDNLLDTALQFGRFIRSGHIFRHGPRCTGKRC